MSLDVIGSELENCELESSGAFTVDFGRMLDKLARYQSNNPASWAWRFVQYSVATECHSLEVVELEAGLWQLTASRPQKQVDVGGVLRQFEHWLLHKQLVPEKLLGSCLLHAAQAGCSHLWVGHWQAGQLVEMHDFLGSKGPVPDFRMTQPEAVVLLIRVTRDFHFPLAEMSARLAFCPIPVLFQNRDCRPNWQARTGDAAVLRAEYLVAPDRIGSCMASRLWQGKVLTSNVPVPSSPSGPLEVDFRGISGEGPADRCALQAFYVSGEPYSGVTAVQFGVALERLASLIGPAAAGVELIVDAPELATDLSGFSLVKDPELMRFIRQKLRQILELNHSAESQVDEILRLRNQTVTDNQKITKLEGLVLLASFLATPALLLYLLFTFVHPGLTAFVGLAFATIIGPFLGIFLGSVLLRILPSSKRTTVFQEDEVKQAFARLRQFLERQCQEA